MAGVDDLDPVLQRAIRDGLMTEAEARDIDAFADGLCQRVQDGELTPDEAADLAGKQGARDGHARLARRRDRPRS